jgi:hypothetical protein
MRLSIVSLVVAMLIGCQRAGPKPSSPVSPSAPVAAARPQPPSVPAESEVANIHLTSLGSSMGSRYNVTLTTGPDVAALIGWLKRIDLETRACA